MTRMHRTSRPLAVLSILLATCATGLVMAATTGMVDLRGMQPVHGDAAAGKAASTVCAACHGADGNAIVPQFPDLAGQSATYLYVQLRGYKDGWRSNAVMQGQAAALSDKDMRDLAAYYAALAPKATQSPPVGSRGAQLFHEGDPALGIPACQGCHGPDGHGPRPDPTSTAPQPAWATFPAVAGQSPDYLLQQLKAYRDGTRTGTSNTEVMHGAVQHLGDADMQALADYIGTL